MTLAMGPLIVLYELSILLAAWLDRVRPVEPRFGRGDDLDDLDELDESDLELGVEPHDDRRED